MGAIGYSTVMNTRPATLDLRAALHRENIKDENIEAEFRSCKPGLFVRILSAIFGDFGNKAGMVRMAALAEYTARVEYAFREGSVSSASATKALVNIQREISAITKAPLLSDSHPDISQALADCMGQTLSFLAENSNSTVPIPSAGRTPADVDWTFGVDMQTSLSQPPANDEMGRRVCAELMVDDRRIRFNLKEFSAGRLSRVVGEVYGQRLAEDFRLEVDRYAVEIGKCGNLLNDKINEYRNKVVEKETACMAAKKALVCISPPPSAEDIKTAAENYRLAEQALRELPKEGIANAKRLSEELKTQVNARGIPAGDVSQTEVADLYACVTTQTEMNLSAPENSLAAIAGNVCKSNLAFGSAFSEKRSVVNTRLKNLDLMINAANNQLHPPVLLQSRETQDRQTACLSAIDNLITRAESAIAAEKALRDGLMAWFTPELPREYTSKDYRKVHSDIVAIVSSLQQLQPDKLPPEKSVATAKAFAESRLSSLSKNMYEYAKVSDGICRAIRPGKTLEDMFTTVTSLRDDNNVQLSKLAEALGETVSAINDAAPKGSPSLPPVGLLLFPAPDDAVSNEQLALLLCYKRLLPLKKFVATGDGIVPDITTAASFVFPEDWGSNENLKPGYIGKVIAFLDSLKNTWMEDPKLHPLCGLIEGDCLGNLKTLLYSPDDYSALVTANASSRNTETPQSSRLTLTQRSGIVREMSYPKPEYMMDTSEYIRILKS